MTDWISAKTPPDKSGRYLVAEDGWRVKDASWDGEHWLRRTSLYVTHWMPLPDPPASTSPPFPVDGKENE